MAQNGSINYGAAFNLLKIRNEVRTIAKKKLIEDLQAEQANLEEELKLKSQTPEACCAVTD